MTDAIIKLKETEKCEMRHSERMTMINMVGPNV